MSDSIKNATSAKGKDIKTIEPHELSIIIQKSDWTMGHIKTRICILEKWRIVRKNKITVVHRMSL